MKFQYYQDARGEWRWRLVAANGEPIANSGEGYKNREDCVFAIELDKRSGSAPVIVG